MVHGPSVMYHLIRRVEAPRRYALLTVQGAVSRYQANPPRVLKLLRGFLWALVMGPFDDSGGVCSMSRLLFYVVYTRYSWSPYYGPIGKRLESGHRGDDANNSKLGVYKAHALLLTGSIDYQTMIFVGSYYETPHRIYR